MTASLCLAATAAVTATHLAAVIDCESERERGCQLLTEPGQPAERALIPPLSPPSHHPVIPPSLRTFVLLLTDGLKENSHIFLLKVVKIPQITPALARTD